MLSQNTPRVNCKIITPICRKFDFYFMLQSKIKFTLFYIFKY